MVLFSFEEVVYTTGMCRRDSNSAILNVSFGEEGG